MLSVIAFARDQGRAESSHDAGDIRPGDLAAGDRLDTAQDSVVIEGPALDDDVLPQLGGVRDLDDLEQGVLDDRIGEAGGNVGDVSSLFLGLLDTGIHKDRAAGPQIDGVFREQSGLCKILYRIIEGFGKGLDKGAAARGTGFVEKDIVHSLVFNADALHILSADVEDTVDLGVKKGCGIVMGDRLHLSLIQKESGFQERLAVARGAAAGDPGTFGKEAVDLGDRVDGSPDRAAVVIAVKRIEQGPVLTDQSQLGRRGAGIDPQEAVSFITGEISPLHLRFFMAAAEIVIFLLRGEKRVHASDLKLHVELAGEPFRHFGQEHVVVLLRVHGAAHGGKEVGVFQVDGMLVVELQGPDESLFELRKEMQRAAQEGYIAPDGLAAGKAADGLIDHCLEDGGSQVFLGGALIDQGLDIGLGKDTAAGGDRIQGPVAAGILVEPCRVCLQKACHLVDKGACAAGADSVHALFDTAVLKVDDLGVLTPQLDGDICFRGELFQCGGDGDDLLDERHLQMRGQREASGACDHRMDSQISELFKRVLRKAPQSSLNVRVVAPVIGEHDIIRRIQDRDFDSGGSDIDSQCVIS